jgi:5'-phosphate synthase pdxT subunit
MCRTFLRRIAFPSVAGSQRTIGVLALQGDVREHESVLDTLGVAHRQVRTAADLSGIDGLIIPGGESSVIDKLARIFEVREPLCDAIANGLPVLGTCAGLILLSTTVIGAIDGQQTFGGLDIAVERNAFGGQLESFETTIDMPVTGNVPVRAAFIRAPIIRDVRECEVVAVLPNGDVVGVRSQNCVGIAFHPEVVGETRVHEWWLNSVVANVQR